jgi:phosphoenolpyruvate phosphomutase
MKKNPPVIAAGAHNGLSAILVERSGFDAVWASSFEISTAHGLPDANILTMSEMLSCITNINNSVKIPVIADCDSGYGNAISVIRMIQEYEQVGIAGVCIEDNIFPKQCSLYPGGKRELICIDEHAGKIRAAKESQRDPDFVVIARTEALIAGYGMDEALKRAHTYADAGADAILIHSKARNGDEVKKFANKWDRDIPLVAVPTTYNKISVTELQLMGFSIIILANYAIRAAIKAMVQVLDKLKLKERGADVETEVSSLDDVFDLVNISRLREYEKNYLSAYYYPKVCVA